MWETIVGNNGTGKTLYLAELLDSYLNCKVKVATNIRRDLPVKIDESKVQQLMHSRHSYIFTDGDDVIIQEKTVILTRSDFTQSSRFKELVNMLCSTSTVLLLDEPEFGLSDTEIGIIAYMLQVISKSFTNVHMCTHHECLLRSIADTYTTIEGSNPKHITEEQASDILMGF